LETKPVLNDFDPLFTAERWKIQGTDVAIATVVETSGSAPRPAGSQMVIDRAGNFAGSVSGGCVEGEVIVAAMAVIRSGSPVMLQFGIQDGTAWQVGLSCGGRIRVYVERLE
jgi:xanthine/CO dehydrogenase XdhC/CoxF family maturation factor